MSALFEVLLHGFLEIFCYGVGRGFLLLVAPHYGVDTSDDASRSKWKWHGWSFERGGRRYFYFEAVQLAGLLVIFALLALIGLASYLSN